MYALLAPANCPTAATCDLVRTAHPAWQQKMPTRTNAKAALSTLGRDELHAHDLGSIGAAFTSDMVRALAPKEAIAEKSLNRTLSGNHPIR